MKKFLICLIVSVAIVFVSSCSLMFPVDEGDFFPHTEKSDDGSTFYTALDISTVALITERIAENGTETATEYQIQIGIRNIWANETAEVAQTADRLGSLLSVTMGLGLLHCGDYVEERYDGIDYREYIYFCYDVVGEYGKVEERTNYGFFYMDFVVDFVNPFWVSNLKQSVSSSVAAVLAMSGQSLLLDSAAVDYKYFLDINSNYSGEDTTWVTKTVIKDGGLQYRLCGMTTKDDYSVISYSTSRMASGWFILPIILGAVVVLMLFLVYRKDYNNSNVFRQEVVNGNSATDEGIIIEQDATPAEQDNTNETANDVRTETEEHDEQR